MKDEHDQRTIDLMKNDAFIARLKRTPDQMKQDAAQDESNKRLIDSVKQDAAYVAQQRARQGMESWLPVSMVANQFGVTSRRIRALLAEGRLNGRQLENGYWEVAYPYVFAMGRRGPKLLMQRPKKVELRTV